MCLIISAPKGTRPKDELLEAAFLNNSDGFGIFFPTKKGNVHIHKTLPGNFDDVTAVYDNYRQVDGPMGFHFRMRTHGDIDQSQAHPYKILNKKQDGRDMYLMHNGVMSSLVKEIDKTKSDTWHFVRYILRPSLLSSPDMIFEEDYQKFLGKMIGSSNKLLILDGLTGKFVKINEDSGTEIEGGIWLSNTYSLSRNKGHNYSPVNGTGYQKEVVYGAGRAGYSTYSATIAAKAKADVRVASNDVSFDKETNKFTIGFSLVLENLDTYRPIKFKQICLNPTRLLKTGWPKPEASSLEWVIEPKDRKDTFDNDYCNPDYEMLKEFITLEPLTKATYQVSIEVEVTNKEFTDENYAEDLRHYLELYPTAEFLSAIDLKPKEKTKDTKKPVLPIEVEEEAPFCDNAGSGNLVYYELLDLNDWDGYTLDDILELLNGLSCDQLLEFIMSRPDLAAECLEEVIDLMVDVEPDE